MSSPNLLQPLNQLLTQAESLLALAQQEDWFGLEAAMVDYLQNVSLVEDKVYLASLTEAGLTLAAQGLILQIQSINQQVDEQAKDFHEKVASELRHMIQSGRALNAYGR